MTTSPTALPGTYQRIANHAAAFARFEASCTPADEVAAKNEGRTVTKAQSTEHEAADVAEQAAFEALLSNVPANIAQLRRKISYIQLHARGGFYLNSDEQEALFESLLKFAPLDA